MQNYFLISFDGRFNEKKIIFSKNSKTWISEDEIGYTLTKVHKIKKNAKNITYNFFLFVRGLKCQCFPSFRQIHSQHLSSLKFCQLIYGKTIQIRLNSLMVFYTSSLCIYYCPDTARDAAYQATDARLADILPLL